MYHCLIDESYLGTIIEHLDPVYFNDKNISSIIDIVTTFYNTRNQIPTVVEIKAHLSTPELIENFKHVVQYMQKFREDNNMQQTELKFNRDELYENTEQFFKQKAVYNTMISIAEESADSDIDTGEILSKFETACNITLDVDRGLDYLNEIDRHIRDLKEVDNTISTGWDWLDDKLDGGFLEHGRSIYVFAGETNIGKSIFLANIAVKLASQGKTV